MNIGPFYFDKKELFLLVAIALLGCSLYFGWPLWVFKAQTLLTLSVIILLTKGLLRSINNDAFFFHVLTTIILAIFLSTFQVILFYLVTFVLFRLLKVI